jgi:hypothetical protein
MDLVGPERLNILRFPKSIKHNETGAMAVATESYQEMTDDQQAIVEMVRSFVDNEILPNAEEYDHED